MDKIILKKAGIGDLMKIYPNYISDFPKSERKPFLFILKQALCGKSDIFAMYDGDKMAAYTITLTKSSEKAVLVDYLAVIEQYRSGGYGSLLIGKLKEFYADRAGIMLEIEELGKADNDAENRLRERRKEFYVRNGFKQMPVKLNLFGVDMHMMYLKINSDTDDFVKTAYEIYDNCIGKKLTKEHIRLEYI